VGVNPSTSILQHKGYYSKEVVLAYLDFTKPFEIYTAIGRWAYHAKKEEEELINVVLFVNEN
jgi:hypothetical protein